MKILKTSTKMAVLVLGCITISGCSTIQGLTERFTGVSCADQVELADTAIDAVVASAAAAYRNNNINQETKEDYATKLFDLMDTLDQASAACDLNDELGKGIAQDVLDEAVKLGEPL